MDATVRRAIEALLLLLSMAGPWALGGTLPEAVLALKVGAAIVLLLWAARAAVTGRLPWRPDRPLAALAGLTLLAALQLAPLPSAVLRVVSPGTAETNEFLRPAAGEVLPGEAAPFPRATAFPVSLSPPDTRGFFVNLLVLTLLYAAARSNLAGPGPLARLGWAAAVNGAALCLLGIAQRVSHSPPGVVYWTVETPGTVFGPFVNRNHLAFYVLPCLGLGSALLAGRARTGAGNLLADPAAFWLLALVAAMAAGVVLSQSRGAVVAGVAAAAGVLAAWVATARRPGGFGWAVCAALVVAAAGGWLGWGSVSDRLGQTDVDKLSDDARVKMWREGLSIFARYPVLGTGGGTYTWVEPSARTEPGLEDRSQEYAHNEYVEALAEGGVPRLLLTLLLVAAPVVTVVRRRRRADGPEGPLLLGGLYGVLAVALQSFVDFGVHIPAVAVLAAVLLAAVMSAADGRGTVEQSGGRGPAWLGALGLSAVAVLLAWDAWTAERAEANRAATVGLTDRESPTPAQADRAVRLLAAAAAARPDNALYRHELGQAYLARALTRPAGSPDRAADLRAALENWRAARDLSPVMAPTHARLGRYRDLFAAADPALAYFDRARRLLPTDAGMIYFCGQARWDAGDVADACADWRQSLTNADTYLPQIAAAAAGRLGPARFLEDVLPDRAAVILKAADRVYPEADAASAPARRLYLERAVGLLAARADKSAAEWETEARIRTALGDPVAAAAAYRQALGREPRQTAWRFAYAQALRGSGALADAGRELETVVAQDPNNRPARDLLAVVRREIALAEK